MTKPEKTALIVDDEPAVRMLLERVIELVGVQPISVGSMAEALEVIATEPNLGLALIDLYLPNGSGWDILDQLRRQEATKDIPAVLMTGMTLSEADKVRLHECQATLMDKGGFDVVTIRKMVTDMLDAAE